MKYKSLVLLTLIFCILPLQTLISSQKNSFLKRILINNIINANTIVQASVTSKAAQKDLHNCDVEIVTFAVRVVLAGDSDLKFITLKNNLNVVHDEFYVKPDFDVDRTYILLLNDLDKNKFTLPAGNLSSFLIEDDKIKNTSLLKNDFIILLNRIRNNTNSPLDLEILSDLTIEFPGKIKLDGEFVIKHPDFKNKPKGEPLLTFYINPTGAVNKDGYPLTFTQIKDVVTRAISSWNSVPCSYAVFSVSNSQYSGSGYSGDGISTITFTR